MEQNGGDRSYWFVGASWGQEDQTERFLREGVWENGYEKRLLDETRAMRPGERIAIKSAFTQKHKLPFDTGGTSVSVMRIKAIGTIIDNPGTGRLVKVEWEPPADRDWYFYTSRQTVWRVRPTSDRARALIDFAFNGAEQDYRWWLSQPYWRERYEAPVQRFAWIEFYEAVADALRDWRDRRGELARLYHEILASAGAAFSGDKDPDGTERPLKEVDPFTFMGLFNRAYTEERRHSIAARVAEVLGMAEEAPGRFGGIPPIYHSRTRFFADTPERNRLTIERLWDVFEAAHALRHADDEEIRARFVEAYDAAQLSTGVGRNLGIGLFWMCPWRLPSLDRHTVAAIEGALACQLKGAPSGALYLDLADQLIELFESGEPFESMPHLVAAAPSWKPEAPGGSDEARRGGEGKEAPPGEGGADEWQEEEEEEEEDQRDDDETRFVPDDAEMERDRLGRGILAIALAGQLHQIWCKANPAEGGQGLPEDRAAFVVHIDAPWGGGKTSFAHFVAAVLNPASRPGRRAARFLEERYEADQNFAELFIDKGAPADHRRPWITVWFNAWRAEHCSPPWWVFYQAIRKQCFAALRREGDAAMRPDRPGGWRRSPFSPIPGAIVAGWLWLQEILWRLWNPKIRGLLATTLLCLILVWLLFEGRLLGLGQKGGVELLVQNGVGFGLGAIGAISFIWAAGAVLTESIMPGTDSWGEKLSLGSGDPFDRFRSHFRRMMEEVRRPVMVVVDDLDRCRPEFVVDLVRGMQTLLRSPRIVFVILGDREWIERSFETHHKEMNAGGEGLEQDFGARFVAKAIQMSFVLPEVDLESQEAYVEAVLFDGRQRASTAPSASDAQAARAVVAAAGPQASERQIKEVASRQGRTLTPGLDRALREERAIASTTSAEVLEGIRHRLQSLSSCLPTNPRQIKRIINAVTMYHAIALQKGLPVDQPRPALALAAWVALMSEWPGSWRLFATWPELLDLLGTDNPVAAIEAAEMPVAAALRDELIRLAQDERLVSLIRGDGKARAPLTAASISDFRLLTPVYGAPARKFGNAAGPAQLRSG